jgi:predicted nucleic acid-binding protein
MARIDGIIDSNIVIDLLRNLPQAVQWQQSLQRQNLAITPIVWMEVVEGAGNTIEQNKALRLMRQFSIEHPNEDDNNWAILQFGRFHLSHRIEYEDIMIASVAVRLNVPLYTLNIRDFAPLPGVDERRPY